MCVQFMISSYQFDGAYRRPMDAILYSASVFICRQRVGWRREQAEGRSCRRILEVHILTRPSPWGKDLFRSVFDLVVTYNPVLPLCYTGSSLSLPPLHIRTRRSRVGEPVKQKNILKSSEIFFTSRTRCSSLMKERGILHSVELHSCQSRLWSESWEDK